MGRANFAAAALCLTMATTSRHAHGQEGSTARQLSVAEAVAIALEHNPDSLSSDAELKGAESSRAEAHGAFGPKVHIDANMQQWNSPFSIPFNGQNLTVRDEF